MKAHEAVIAQINKHMTSTTSLHNSPFALLDVTVRDKAIKIVEQAEEKSLYLDSDVCTKARNDLTTARNRLTSEISWLPGVAPNRASTLLDALNNDIDSIKGDTSLPALANANLLAAAFEILDPEMDSDDWRDWIVDFAFTVDLINPETVLCDINADRMISGFPEIKGTEQIESELEERRRYYTETIKTALNKLSSMKLVEVVTEVVEHTTESGEEHAPQLIHELVDRYEVEANRYLEPESENIFKLIETIRTNAPNGEASIKPQIDKLDQIVRKWDAIAQPIQLSMKAQGLDHKLSHDVAWGIRGLTIDLFNQHDMVSTVTRFNKILQELFAELPTVAEKLAEDSDTVEEILKDRKDAEKRKAERVKEITYQTEIGMFFKDTLRISPDGVEWKGRKIALDSISRVRWGAVRKSVNGIPSGTDYTIAVGGNNIPDLVIETGKDEIYQRFTDSLWKTVCVRLIEQYLQALKEGERIPIGGVSFDDEGIFLTKHKFLGDETIYRKWGEVTYVSHNGSLVVTAQDDKKTYIELAYLSVANAHILEAIIRLSFKSWKGRLSGLSGN